ncbi:MAG: D-methionine transport system substrate-binding protein [Actinomycetota bacterium]|nr:D-methionine transport system substrate-binding protein [Actinomycetota bacterium]
MSDAGTPGPDKPTDKPVHTIADDLTAKIAAKVRGGDKPSLLTDLTDLTDEPRRPRRRGLFLIGTAAAVATTILVGGLVWANRSDANEKYSATDQPLRVFASVAPHAEILKHVNDTLAKGAVRLTVVEESDGVNGNDVVEHGDADASYFQHVPYLDSDTKDKGYTDLTVAATVHVEPYGIYSKKYPNVGQVPDGGLVLLSNNVSNFARGLYLLQAAGLIKIDHQFGDTSADALTITEKNIVDNPKHLKFQQVEPAQIPRSLPDAALGLINGNVALEAGLSPTKDALLLEKGQGNPYANILVVPTALKDDPRVKTLSQILQGPEVADFIAKRYPGSVLPVHEGGH